MPAALSQPMRRVATLFVLAVILGNARAATAQEPPPIPWFVVDIHGAVANFPSDPVLAASRGLNQAELPGTGLGGNIAVHLYPFRVRAITVGFGGRLTAARARRVPAESTGFRVVTERFTYLGPQLSLNFGSGAGWSYLSAGIAGSTWSIVPAGADPAPADDERLRTIDYGGGARWFAKPHVAFSFDVRFFAVNPGTAAFGFPESPRATFLVVGAGVSLK